MSLRVYPDSTTWISVFPAPNGDPLAPFTWTVRFQTHNGNNVPRWLWQDDAMTIPAVNAFDPIAVWEDLSGNARHLTQPDPDKQPVLNFENGVPIVESDGLDDFFLCTLVDVDLQSIFLQATSPSTGLNDRILGYQSAGRGIFPSGDTWHWFAAFSNSLVASNVWSTLSLDVQSTSLAVWGEDGTPTGATFDPIDAVGGQLRVFWNGTDAVVVGQLAALMITTQPTADQVSEIAAALNVLNAPLLS